MSSDVTPTHRCKHCGDPVGMGAGGHWIHAGPRGYLYRCQRNAPYGYEAEPGEPLDA